MEPSRERRLGPPPTCSRLGDAEPAAAIALSVVPIPDFLERLLTRRRPVRPRDRSRRVWREGCGAFADEVGGDLVGSSFARVRGTADGPTLAVVGHIDEIGLHVSHIDDDGYLRFGQVGGWDPARADRPARRREHARRARSRA